MVITTACVAVSESVLMLKLSIIIKGIRILFCIVI
jgi:hypothetical protein